MVFSARDKVLCTDGYFDNRVGKCSKKLRPASVWRPSAARGFGSGGGDGLGSGVAERVQSALGFLAAARVHFGEGEAKCFDAKIVATAGAFDAVEERGDFDE